MKHKPTTLPALPSASFLGHPSLLHRVRSPSLLRTKLLLLLLSQLALGLSVQPPNPCSLALLSLGIEGHLAGLFFLLDGRRWLGLTFLGFVFVLVSTIFCVDGVDPLLAKVDDVDDAEDEDSYEGEEESATLAVLGL